MYAQLKCSDLRMSRIGFGCANFGGIGSAPHLIGKGDGEQQCHRMLNAAIEAGINYFDTAPTYGGGRSEQILGRWLKARHLKRETLIISSKVTAHPRHLFSAGGLTRRSIRKQLDDTLRRLNLDYLDILFIHAPDPHTPLEETLAALTEAVVAKKVMVVGACNVDHQYLTEALKVSRSRSFAQFGAVQNSYSYLDRSDEVRLLPFCHEQQIVYIGYSPLCGGLLTGKYVLGQQCPRDSRLGLRGDLYRAHLTSDTFARIEAFAVIARKCGLSLSALMYAWLYRKSTVNAILIGPRSLEQFEALVEGLGAVLGESVWQELEACSVVADARPMRREFH